MVNHKVKAALVALNALSEQAVNEVKKERGDSASWRVSGFSRKLMILARELYPIAHCVDPANGIAKADEFCARVLFMAANKGVTKATKEIKRKAKGLAEIKSMLESNQGRPA